VDCPALTIDLKRLKKMVVWRDLVPMQTADGLVECLHPLPWLAGSWIFAATGWWLPALLCSFLFFLTALRLNHEAIHNNLGFGPRGHRIVLHGLSMLMLGSNNSVAANHLHHHKHVMQPDDLEGKCGRMSAWRVLAYGPAFPVEMHRAAWNRGNPALQQRMRIDLTLNLAIIGLFVATGWTVLGYHLITVTIAQCLTAFFAVWITHRGCHADQLIARTQRAPIINLLSYNMLLHLEHHLFPGVPVKRLNLLAARIDKIAPEINACARRVVGTATPHLSPTAKL
jgi:fatty acid desaturase